MRKLLFVALGMMCAFMLAACSSSSPKLEIIQDRVIQVTYDSFDFEKNAEYLNKYDTFEAGGCTAVKVVLDDKVYVGRNYDFYCSDTPAFIVRNNAGKYKTIGIGNAPQSLPNWSDDYTLDDEKLAALPYFVCDVMSEAGLYCETNIRISEDGVACSSTNPGAPRYCTQAFMTLMLSQYASIDEILAHIDDYDWFDLAALGFNQSFLLTDQSGRSVLIEFAADSWKFSDVDYNANFFVNEEYSEMANYPIGEQRAEKVLDYLPNVKTPEDIFDMMSLVKYSQFYTAACDVDFALGEFYQDLGYDKVTVKENIDEARNKMKAKLDEFDKYSWQDLIDNKGWETTFMTVANVSDLTLDVHFSEHYGISFTVGFE